MVTTQHVLVFRIAIGALALGSLLIQLVVIPRVAADYAATYPEVAYLEIPYVIAFVTAFGGLQVSSLAACQLLSTAIRDESRSTRWVSIMTFSLGFMAVLFAGVFAHAGFIANVGGPPMMFGLLASLAVVPSAVVLRNKALSFSLADVNTRISHQFNG